MNPYEFFGCAESPFKNTLNPRYFFATEQHEEGLQRILLAIQDGRGMALLQGEAGTGKSLVSQMVISQLDDAKFRLALIVDPDRRMTGTTFLRLLSEELGLDPGRYLYKLKKQLRDYMVEQWQNGRRTVIIIDEAHLCSANLLETLRVFLNIETPDQKLSTIVLLAQQEINEKLARMPQLHQRIDFRMILHPLTPLQTGDYIMHRLRIAGAHDTHFTSDAITHIHTYTQGIPRRINIVCDHALLVAASVGTRDIMNRLVEGAITEAEGGRQDGISDTTPQEVNGSADRDAGVFDKDQDGARSNLVEQRPSELVG